MKKTSVLGSHDYFMRIAFLTTMKSENPRTKVGTCIVNKDGKVVGLGYNRAPTSISSIPWKRDTLTNEKWLDSKYPYVFHAEMDAIMNKTGCSSNGCTMYTLVHPWNECAKLIIESGIKKVFY